MGEVKAAMEQAHRVEVGNLASQHAKDSQAAEALLAAKEEAANQLVADVKQKAKADMKV